MFDFLLQSGTGASFRWFCKIVLTGSDLEEGGNSGGEHLIFLQNGRAILKWRRRREESLAKTQEI